MATVITSERIKELLFSKGIDYTVPGKVRLPYTHYALYDQSWFESVAVPHIRKVLKKRIKRYKKNKSDCDDFARKAAQEARDIHIGTEDGPEDCGIAFGVADFALNPVAHEINVAIFTHDAGQTLELRLWEPQTCEFISLNREEIESCFYLEF